jgi:glutathione peroxidase
VSTGAAPGAARSGASRESTRWHRDPIYAELTTVADVNGDAGDVAWNFEKFLVAPDGRIAGRFRPKPEPAAPEIRSAIEAVLPG